MANITPLEKKQGSSDLQAREIKEAVPKQSENKRSSEANSQKQEAEARAFATILAQQKLKNKSHSFEIGKKYTKRFCVYLLAIGFFVLMLYFLAPVFNVPPTYLIVPLFSAIGGTLMGSKVNKLIDSAGFCVPKWMLDENSQILVEAEHRLEELRELDKKSGKDDYSTIIQELNNNVAVCQAINEAGSKHFINLFIKDIKLLMKIPSRSMSEVYRSNLQESQIKAKRIETLAQARKLLAPYDLNSKHTLSTSITEMMDKILTPKGYNKTTRVKPLLLVGPPGIGKTFLIKSLGKIFKAPVCVINMGKETLDKVEGMLLSSSSGTGPMPIAGLILKDLTNPHTNPSGCKDIIVLLDEIDKAFVGAGKEQSVTESTAKFISFLHHFLQVDIMKMHDKGYNVMYGIENVYVVCTANRNCFLDSFIEPTTRNSLMDRVNVINMPDLTKSAKIDILKGLLKDRLKADAELSPLQKLMAEQFMETIILQIVENEGLDAPALSKHDAETQTPPAEVTASATENKTAAESILSLALTLAKNSNADKKETPMPSLLDKTSAVNQKEVPAQSESASTPTIKALEGSSKTIELAKTPKISEKFRKENTGLRKALELLDVYYEDFYILLDPRYGVKSLTGIINEYLKEESDSMSASKEADSDLDSVDSFVIDIQPDNTAMTPLLDAQKRKDTLAKERISSKTPFSMNPI